MCGAEISAALTAGLMPTSAGSFSCFANYRLSFPFTDHYSTAAVTTLFSTSNTQSSGIDCTASSLCSDGCWASCMNNVTLAGCSQDPEPEPLPEPEPEPVRFTTSHYNWVCS